MAHNVFNLAWLEAWQAKIQASAIWQRPKRFEGNPLNRDTAWLTDCLCCYSYGQGNGAVCMRPQPRPAWLDTLESYIMPECGLLDRTQWPDSCNANHYTSGKDSVGPHYDDEDLFQGWHQDITIISLSFGGTRAFELRQNKNLVWEHKLNAGDLVAMEQGTQKLLKHGAPAEKELGQAGQRINLTWRWIAKHQPHCPKATAGQGRVRGPPRLPVHTATQEQWQFRDALTATLRPPLN